MYGNKRKVEVNKNELLTQLKKNKELHIEELKETQEEYNDAYILAVEKLLESAKTRPGIINNNIHLSAPTSHVKEYGDIIDMLEFSTQESLEITMEEYKSWVKNEWSWSESFAMTKLSYLN